MSRLGSTCWWSRPRPASAKTSPSNRCLLRLGVDMRRYLIAAAALVVMMFPIIGSTQQTFSLRSVATGLKGPWEVAWGPDDQLWVTERLNGRVVRVNPKDGAITPAVMIDEVYPGTSWHEGLLG